ncbi:MAG: hypothetical protein RLZ63_493 [Pseudomonadota bacterium]
MSDASAFGFGKFIPGFDFLQNIAQSAGKAQPGAAPSWVAPTLSVEELDKRITDLKAVQFWLEQNVTTLKATIQAMEVQKMTLATLQGMNVNMADLAKAFSVKPESAAAPAPTSSAAASAAPAETESPPDSEVTEDAEPQVEAQAKPSRKGKDKAADKPMVDPMAWWGSLSQQFQNIAATAMKDVAAEAMKAKSASAAEDKPSEATRPAAKKTARKPAAKKTTAKKPATKAAARTASRKTAAK